MEDRDVVYDNKLAVGGERNNFKGEMNQIQNSKRGRDLLFIR